MIATPWPPRIGTEPNFLSSTWMSQKSCMHGCGMVISFFFHVMLFTHCKHRCCKHAGILPSSAMCLPWLKRLHAHGHENTNLSCSIFNIENVWKHCIHGKDAISGCWHIPVKPCWQSQNFNQSQQFQTNDKFPRGTLQETQPWILKHRSPRSQQWDHPHHMQHLKKNTPTKKTEQKVFVGNT